VAGGVVEHGGAAGEEHVAQHGLATAGDWHQRDVEEERFCGPSPGKGEMLRGEEVVFAHHVQRVVAAGGQDHKKFSGSGSGHGTREHFASGNISEFNGGGERLAGQRVADAGLDVGDGARAQVFGQVEAVDVQQAAAVGAG